MYKNSSRVVASSFGQRPAGIVCRVKRRGLRTRSGCLCKTLVRVDWMGGDVQ